MRSSNVLKFPGGQSSDWSLKLFAVLFLLFLGYMITLEMGFSGNGFMLIILLGVLYQFFVRQGGRYQSYLQQNRLLLIILLVVFLLAFQWKMLLILLMAGAYWLLVGRSGREAPYFIRFHILTGLILNAFVLLAYFLTLSGLQLLLSLFKLLGLAFLVTGLGSVLSMLPLAFLGVFGLVAVWLSWNVLLGRTPYIAWVTANVRHWV